MMLATGRESTQGYKGLQAINGGKSTKKTRSGIMTIGYIDNDRYNKVIDYVNQNSNLVRFAHKLAV